MANAAANYTVVGDDDGRWYVLDGQCVIHDSPFPSKASAEQYRDDVAARLDSRLAASARIEARKPAAA